MYTPTSRFTYSKNTPSYTLEIKNSFPRYTSTICKPKKKLAAQTTKHSHTKIQTYMYMLVCVIGKYNETQKT